MGWERWELGSEERETESRKEEACDVSSQRE